MVLLEGYGDPASIRGIADGIVYKVCQGLFQPVPVPMKAAISFEWVQKHFESLLRKERAKAIDHSPDQLIKLEGDNVEIHLP